MLFGRSSSSDYAAISSVYLNVGSRLVAFDDAPKRVDFGRQPRILFLSKEPYFHSISNEELTESEKKSLKSQTYIHRVKMYIQKGEKKDSETHRKNKRPLFFNLTNDPFSFHSLSFFFRGWGVSTQHEFGSRLFQSGRAVVSLYLSVCHYSSVARTSRAKASNEHRHLHKTRCRNSLRATTVVIVVFRLPVFLYLIYF